MWEKQVRKECSNLTSLVNHQKCFGRMPMLGWDTDTKTKLTECSLIQSREQRFQGSLLSGRKVRKLSWTK